MIGFMPHYVGEVREPLEVISKQTMSGSAPLYVPGEVRAGDILVVRTSSGNGTNSAAPLPSADFYNEVVRSTIYNGGTFGSGYRVLDGTEAGTRVQIATLQGGGYPSINEVIVFRADGWGLSQVGIRKKASSGDIAPQTLNDPPSTKPVFAFSSCVTSGTASLYTSLSPEDPSSVSGEGRIRWGWLGIDDTKQVFTADMGNGYTQNMLFVTFEALGA